MIAETAEPVSLYEFHLAHIDALRHQRRSPATLRAYTIYCGGFIEFMKLRGLEHPALADLTPAHVRAYQDHIRAHSDGARGGAVAERQAVALLKSWATWLWRREHYVTDPLTRLEKPRLAKIHRVPFTKEECVRLLEAATLGPDPALERALLILGLDTGCRVGEMCDATLDDVDLEAGTILFRKTKTGRPRRVHFRVPGRADGGPCVVALAQWLEVRPQRAAQGLRTLFVSPSGQPLNTNRARRIYYALGESAGVVHAHPHRGRHTAASQFLTELPGAELALRKRLGHLSHDVLADYVTFSDQTTREHAGTASISQKWGL